MAPRPGTTRRDRGEAPATYSCVVVDRERAPRPRSAAAPRVVAALVVVVLGSSALLGVWLADPPGAAGRPSGTASAAAPTGADQRPGRGASGDADEVGALAALLEARAGALLGRDRDGWMSGVFTGPAAAGFAQRQEAMFDDVAAVPLAEWGWELIGEGPDLSPQRLAALGGQTASRRPWVAHVALVYRLRGGGGQVRREKYLTVVPTPSGVRGGWALADDTDGPTEPDLWDLGPVQVSAGSRSLVLGTGDLTGVAALADTASARVDAVWGRDWPRSTVVEVPASQDQMARLLGRGDASALEQVAAVTTGERLGDEVATTGDRVVVNPRGFSGLTEVGRLVVMTHELAHVATRASTSAPVPAWLSEGYADWLGYREQGLGAATIAAPLVDAVRDGDPGSLAGLPSADDFAADGGRAGLAYAGSWVAADLVARRYGEQALTAVYRDVASGAPTPGGTAPSPLASTDERTGAAAADRALRARLGVDTTAFTSAWRQRVTLIASGEG